VNLPSNLRCFVCAHVFLKQKPVLLASFEGGDWSFTCGEGHPDSGDAYRTVGIGHMIADDPTLGEILNLPPNWEAERPSTDMPWIRTAVSMTTQ
jgi:hypothetical protein